jgi:hypothetical protein
VSIVRGAVLRRLAPGVLTPAALILALVAQQRLSASSGQAVWLFLGALGLLVLRRLYGPPAELRAAAPWTRLEVLGIALITLAALLLRCYRIDQIPPLNFNDVTMNNNDALELLSGRLLGPVNAMGQGTVWYYLLAGLFLVFGAYPIVGTLLAVVVGTATVPALHLLARRLVGPWWALLASGLLAASRYHMTLSRIAFDVNLLPPLALLTLAWAIQALDTRRLRPVVLASLAMTLALYSYISSRMIPVVLVILVVCEAVRQGSLRRFWSAHWKQLLLFTVLSGVLLAPLVYTAVRDWETFNRRGDQILISHRVPGDQLVPSLLRSAQKHLLMMNVRGDWRWRHNISGQPQLEPLSAGVFAFGAGVLLLGMLGRPRAAFLILWYLCTLFPSVLTVGAPNNLRVLPVAALAPLFIAVGLRQVRQDLSLFLGRFSTVLVGAGALCLLAIAAQRDVTDYFRWGEDPRARASFSAREEAQAMQIVDLDRLRRYGMMKNLMVHMENPNHPTVKYLCRDTRAYRRALDLGTDLPVRRGLESWHLFQVYSPNDELLEELLAAYYPDAELRRIYGVKGQQKSAFSFVLLSPEQVQSIIGLQASLRTVDEPEQPLVSWRLDEPALEWTGGMVRDHPLPALLRLEGSVWIEREGMFFLTVQGAEEYTLALDGRRVQRFDRPLRLLPGYHPLRVDMVLAGEKGAVRFGLSKRKGSMGRWPRSSFCTLTQHPPGRAAAPAASSEVEYRLAAKIRLEVEGGPGVRAGGIDVGPDGAVYVADREHDRIVVFDAKGRLLRSFGASGPGLGELKKPLDVVLLPDSGCAVLDTANSRIQFFDGSGQALRWIRTDWMPGGLDRCANGDWAVVAARKLSILREDGRRIQLINPRGVDAFGLPRRVLVLADGGFWVTDIKRKEILRFDSAGRLLGTISEPRIQQYGYLCQTPDGSVHMTTTSSIVSFTADGRRLLETGIGRVNCGLTGIAVDAEGRIYAICGNGERLFIWEPVQ